MTRIASELDFTDEKYIRMWNKVLNNAILANEWEDVLETLADIDQENLMITIKKDKINLV